MNVGSFLLYEVMAILSILSDNGREKGVIP